MLLSPVTIFSQAFLIRRGFSTTEGSSESVSPPSEGEIILGLLVILTTKVQEALIDNHNNESETRVTLQYTHTHCTLVRLWGSSPVYLCRQTEER